jgi:hypothetical protein
MSPRLTLVLLTVPFALATQGPLEPEAADLAARIEAAWAPDPRVAALRAEVGGPVGALNADPNLRLMRFDARDRPLYYQAFNLAAAATIGVDALWPGGAGGFALDGTGFDGLGQWDTGSPRTTHQEFSGRITLRDGFPSQSRHATHVAGTLIASGILPGARGMAPAALLKYWDWNNDELEQLYAAHEGLLVSNHSYGSSAGWTSVGGTWYWYGDPALSPVEDASFGSYTAACQYLDEVAWLKPYWQPVRAAGNHRGESGPAPGGVHLVYVSGQWIESTDVRDPDGGLDGFDCLSPPTTMKNALVIGSVLDLPGGATDPADIVLSSYSAFGPTDDGRIKPDLVANGSSLLSTFETSDTATGTMGGTSMAAPTVTGAIALLQQLYIDGHPDPDALRGGRAPLSSSIRAALIHTAAEAGDAPGPDYRHGWGLVDAHRAAQLIADENNTRRRLLEGTLSNGGRDTLHFVTDGGPLRFTLAWTDRPATPLPLALDDPTPRLIHDLDLELRNATGPPLRAWALDPADPSAPATAAGNQRDNVERIDGSLPAGSFFAVLSHGGSLLQPQRWSLTWDNARPLANLRAQADRSSVLPGDTLSIELSLSGALGLRGVRLQLDWNLGALRLHDFSEGPLLSRGGIDATLLTVVDQGFAGTGIEIERSGDLRGLDRAAGSLGTLRLIAETSTEFAVDFSNCRLVSAAGEEGHELARPLLHFNIGDTPDDLEISFSDEGLFLVGEPGPVDVQLAPCPDLGQLRLELPLDGIEAGTVIAQERFAAGLDWSVDEGILVLDWSAEPSLALPHGERFCTLWASLMEARPAWLQAGSAQAATGDARPIAVIVEPHRLNWSHRLLSPLLAMEPAPDALRPEGSVLFRWEEPRRPQFLVPPMALLLSRKADLVPAETLWVAADSLRTRLMAGDWWWSVLVDQAEGPALANHPRRLRVVGTGAATDPPRPLADGLPAGLSAAPNPFNPATWIRFELSSPGPVRLRIVDLLGRPVALLVEEPLAAGPQQHLWEPDPRLASGLYFAVLESSGHLEIRKLHLLR